MGRKFTSKQLSKARRTELYAYVLSHHEEAVKRVGSTLVVKEQHYVKIRKGYSGYIDYLSGERGNSIDFLIKYLGYSFEDAVDALLCIKGGEAIGKQSVQA